MKKKIALLPFLMSILFVLAGCSMQSQTLNLAVCGSYAVPGMFCRDLRGGTFQCEVMQTDSEGRVLFAYETYNAITGKAERAVVVCQSVDLDGVYFYEDICYLIGSPGDEEIETLKHNNDWGEALDTSRMVRRSNKTSLDLNIVSDTTLNTRKVISLCSEQLEIPGDSHCSLLLVDENPSGQAIFLLTAESETRVQKYLVLVNAQYDIHTKAIDGKTEDLYLLPSFKEEGGWGRTGENQ